MDSQKKIPGLELALQCPQCKTGNLHNSISPAIKYVCKQCGYIIWNGEPPAKIQTASN